MISATCMSAITVLVLAAAPADETYTIKLKESSKGSITEAMKDSTEISHVTVEDSTGKSLLDKKEKKTKSFAFKETIIEKV